jgi:hypothetical protein
LTCCHHRTILFSLHSSDDPNDWGAEELHVQQAIEKDNGMRWL